MNSEALSKTQRDMLAEKLAAERLETINKQCAPVHYRETFYTRYVKRAFDFMIALIALIVTLPINLIIGIITFFDVGMPIFFRQERISKNGKTFKIVKFRNMTNARDENGELLPAKDRVTKWGKFVRATSLDELLNFWSILKGDMSLIGPRPLNAAYAKRFNKRHAQRTLVRPGLECPPRARNMDMRTWHDQLENDIWYVENISFATDCKMLFLLVCFTLDRKSAAKRAGVKRGTFIGYDWDGRAISQYDLSDEYLESFETPTVKSVDYAAEIPG